MLRRHYSQQAGWSGPGKGQQGCGQIFCEAVWCVQRDPLSLHNELIWGTLQQEALLPENRQPMFGYYFGRLRLLACGSRNEPLGGINVLSGRNGPNLQTQEATPHLVNPWVVTRKSVIPLREDVHQSDTAGQIILWGCCRSRLLRRMLFGRG